MYDLIIIGAGPAGMGAGMAAALKRINVLILSKDVYEPEDELALGVFRLQEAAAKFDQFSKNHKLELRLKTEVIKLEKNIVSFSAEEKSGKVSYAKSVIIACGNNDLSFDAVTQKGTEGKIKVGYNLKTSVPGIWAAGDCVNMRSLDPLVVFGEGVKAVEDIVNGI